MGIEDRIPTDVDWPAMVRADGRAFGEVPTEAQIAERRSTVDLDRFRIAVDATQVVGVAGSFAFDVTLPGGATAPAAGLTWVGVSATHRRRGIVTELMRLVHQDADDRGEPIAMLFASEGGIYERFGYGIASTMRFVEIDRTTARLRPDLAVDRDAVRFVEGDDARDHLAAMWERHRRSRAGEISRDAAWHDMVHELRERPGDGSSATFHLAHRDGYAAYRIRSKWTGRPMNTLELVEFVPVTEQAHLDLWHTILGVDLVATVASKNLPPDEALPMLLTDVRPFATTVAKDGFWANVLDPGVAFGARTYGTVDRLVVEAEGVRWAVESDGDEASCQRVRTRPDLVTDRPSLGALLFGGVRPSQLARGRRLEGRSDDALRRADAFFVVGPAPHCATWF
jgi:predicted acetyltransferase